MKKRLAMLLSVAMAFSMFANVAFGADATLTTTQKYEALVEAGIFNGIPGSTDPQLNVQTDRAQFAKILALTTGLEQVTGVTSFKDAGYATNWAKGYIEAVVKAGYMNGVGGEKFNLTGKITGEQMAKSFALALGLEEVKDAAAIDGVSAWATGWVAAIKEAGFDFSMNGKWNTPVTRAVLIDAAYAVRAAVGISVDSYKILDEKTVEFTMSDKGTQKVTLDKALVAGEEQTVKFTYKDKSFEAKVVLGALKAEKAAQTGAKVITVDFNRYVTEAEKKDLTFEVKSGVAKYNFVAKYSDDNTKVALDASYLPAGEYTVTVKGQEPLTVKVEAARVTKVEIGIEQLQVTASQNLGIVVSNQFGEDVTGTESLKVSVSGSKAGYTEVSRNSDNKYVYTPATALTKDEVVVVTAVHPTTGITAYKQFTATDASDAKKITLGTVAPKEGQTRITSGDTDLVLPYTLEDQYGKALTLPEGTLATNATSTTAATYAYSGNLRIMVSNTNIVDLASFKVDSKGVLTFNTIAKDNTNVVRDGYVVITLVNPFNGASATTTINVEKASEVKTFQIGSPAKVPTAGAWVEYPYVAADNYGAQIENKKFASSAYRNQITVSANGVALTSSNVKWGVNGELYIKLDTEGTNLIMVNANQNYNASNVTVTVQEAAVPTKVTSLNVPALFAETASKTVTSDDITVVDQFGNKLDASEYGFVVVGTTGNKIDAGAIGTVTYTLQINKVDGTKAFDHTFKVQTIEQNKVTKYAIDGLSSLYVNTATGVTYGGNYAKDVNVLGKTSGGASVQINQDVVTAITSSDVNVVDVHEGKVYAKAKGEATISAWVAGSKVAEVTVQTTDVAPYAKSVTISGVGEAIELNASTPASAVITLTVKDQYGVEIAPAGSWTSTNSKVAYYDAATKTIKKGTATGDAVVSFVTNNGIVTSVSVVVN